MTVPVLTVVRSLKGPYVMGCSTSAVLCSGGCALLAVSSLLAIITIFLPSGACERRICTLAGYMQMAAGKCLSVTAACVSLKRAWRDGGTRPFPPRRACEQE
ncbi:hypothetical protein ANANG_G00162370 [Anguilla anguilla]|uniref:Uncharacterized protein n=1 Tax=Anguilla anguilla TaxID=7936 RepID=A0A9D3RUW1_ANGAN|nr:hypothetical protein ANANG_G00162370 [Anguilla anguilla]